MAANKTSSSNPQAKNMSDVLDVLNAARNRSTT
jgi:hypothetical protein